jgi:hypothetical protein
MERVVMEEAEKEGRKLPPGEVFLPNFKELQARQRSTAEKKFLEERAVLEKNVSDINKQIQQIQKQLRELDGTEGVRKIDSFFKKASKEESKKPSPEVVSKKRKASEDLDTGVSAGAVGPDGDFVEFPEYNGEDEPQESKKAFTLFCKRTRKEVKNSLSSTERKDKNHVNGMLKDRWDALTQDEKQVWNEWEIWDGKRYEHQLAIYHNPKNSSLSRKKSSDNTRSDSQGSISSIPKKRN